MYKIRGLLETDFLIIYAKHSGLYCWDEGDAVCNKVNTEDVVKYELDQIKATPNGQYVCIGFPEANKVVFYMTNKDECNLT